MSIAPTLSARCAPVFTLIVDTSDGLVANSAKSPAARRTFLFVCERGVVGYSSTQAGPAHAYIWQDGLMQDLLGPGAPSTTAAPQWKVYRPFEQAREYARSLGLRSQKEWRAF